LRPAAVITPHVRLRVLAEAADIALVKAEAEGYRTDLNAFGEVLSCAGR
jgi:hypothetical protein